MSNSGVKTGFAKCFIFFMAAITLLQGGIYLGLSIWGITLRQCSKETTDIISKPIQFAMDLIYFLNEDCGNPSIKVPDLADPVTLDVDFSKAAPVENRMFIFLIAYAAISTVWVVTSLAVISTLCGTITKTINRLCFWPWFLAIMAGCILDVVATGYHIHDLINTTSVVKTFDYLGITAKEKIIDVLTNFDAYFITPAVIMTCISSRAIFIWLLNIFGSSFCLSLTSTLSKRNPAIQSSVASLATTSTAPVTNFQQQSHCSDTETNQQHVTRFAERSKPSLPLLEIQSLQSQLPMSPETNQISAAENVVQPSILAPNLYRTAPSTIESQPKIDMANQQRISSQYPQELSSISPLNNRYSTTNDNLQLPMQNQRVSEELRGQLPWSYTSMPPPVPKKPQVQVYPHIPEPDYGH